VLEAKALRLDAAVKADDFVEEVIAEA